MSIVLQRRERGVLHLTLNRPEVRNAMSLAMVRELRAALAAAEGGGTRAVVLRGAGGHFCAGGDVADMAAARARAGGGDGSGDALSEVSAAFGELALAFDRTPLATVAVVEGAVLGGGFGLACVADVVLAGDSAAFRLPETSIGIVPAQIAAFLVERIGSGATRRLAVTGARLDAQAALALGLVHEVHAAAELDAALQRTLDQLLACAPGAIAQTKALIARTRQVPAEQLIPEAAALFARAVLGDEGREGTLAFVSRRKPAWASA